MAALRIHLKLPAQLHEATALADSADAPPPLTPFERFFRAQRMHNVSPHPPPHTHRNSLSATFTTSAESLKGTITKALNARAKDNSTIYLEPVPNQATLKDVPGAGMVKAVPFAGSTSGEATNLKLGFVGYLVIYGLSFLVASVGGKQRAWTSSSRIASCKACALCCVNLNLGERTVDDQGV